MTLLYNIYEKLISFNYNLSRINIIIMRLNFLNQISLPFEIQEIY